MYFDYYPEDIGVDASGFLSTGPAPGAQTSPGGFVISGSVGGTDIVIGRGPGGGLPPQPPPSIYYPPQPAFASLGGNLFPWILALLGVVLLIKVK